MKTKYYSIINRNIRSIYYGYTANGAKAKFQNKLRIENDDDDGTTKYTNVYEKRD